MKVCGKDIKVQGRVIRLARIDGENFVFLENPEEAISALRQAGKGIDLFTFTRPLPNTKAEYDYAIVWDNLAVLPVSTFEQWFKQQIDGKTRNMVRRGEKKGVVVREAAFDEAFARGILDIYNETPVRQGRLFPHYGKSFEEVRRMSATFMDNSIFIGAFLEEKLIGFLKLTISETKSQATVMHIISMIEHRDKAPTNALLAHGVEACAKRGISNLVYSNFSYGKKQRDSLSDFKENNGFKRVGVPRYYVPLTAAGRIGLRFGLHRTLLDRLPAPLTAKLREYRDSWYARKVRQITEGQKGPRASVPTSVVEETAPTVASTARN
jgi:hypothetical protein